MTPQISRLPAKPLNKAVDNTLTLLYNNIHPELTKATKVGYRSGSWQEQLGLPKVSEVAKIDLVLVFDSGSDFVLDQHLYCGHDQNIDLLRCCLKL